ncbi:hypothetical protein RhiirA4_404256, partial [Rhizophagus irregularis]
MSLALTLKYYIKYELDNPKNPPKQGLLNLGSQFVYVALLGCDGYQRLAAQPILDDDEYQENSDGIVVDEQEIGN